MRITNFLWPQEAKWFTYTTTDCVKIYTPAFEHLLSYYIDPAAFLSIFFRPCYLSCSQHSPPLLRNLSSFHSPLRLLAQHYGLTCVPAIYQKLPHISQRIPMNVYILLSSRRHRISFWHSNVQTSAKHAITVCLMCAPFFSSPRSVEWGDFRRTTTWRKKAFRGEIYYRFDTFIFWNVKDIFFSMVFRQTYYTFTRWYEDTFYFPDSASAIFLRAGTPMRLAYSAIATRIDDTKRTIYCSRYASGEKVATGAMKMASKDIKSFQMASRYLKEVIYNSFRNDGNDGSLPVVCTVVYCVLRSAEIGTSSFHGRVIWRMPIRLVKYFSHLRNENFLEFYMHNVAWKCMGKTRDCRDVYIWERVIFLIQTGKMGKV